MDFYDFGTFINFGVMVAQVAGWANKCLHHMGHLLSKIAYHEMTTNATAIKGKNRPVATNYPFLKMLILLGRACPKPCFRGCDKLEAVYFSIIKIDALMVNSCLSSEFAQCDISSECS